MAAAVGRPLSCWGGQDVGVRFCGGGDLGRGSGCRGGAGPPPLWRDQRRSVVAMLQTAAAVVAVAPATAALGDRGCVATVAATIAPVAATASGDRHSSHSFYFFTYFR